MLKKLILCIFSFCLFFSTAFAVYRPAFPIQVINNTKDVLFLTGVYIFPWPCKIATWGANKLAPQGGNSGTWIIPDNKCNPQDGPGLSFQYGRGKSFCHIAVANDGGNPVYASVYAVGNNYQCVGELTSSMYTVKISSSSK